MMTIQQVYVSRVATPPVMRIVEQLLDVLLIHIKRVLLSMVPQPQAFWLLNHLVPYTIGHDV